MEGTLAVTGDPAADRLVNGDPLALLIGMLLDQQVPIEVAFAAPARLAERLAERFDVGAIAAMPEDELVAVCCAKPAIHRYPAAMARRIHALAGTVVERYGGEPEAIWRDVADGEELRRRLLALPGFGDEKARIFVALLAKRFGVRPPGWEEASAPFSDDQPRSAADAGSREAFERVKAWKREMRARGRGKADPV